MHRCARLLPALALALQACVGDGSATPRATGDESAARDAAATRVPTPVSAPTSQEAALRRFQSPIEPVKALAGGQPSLEALAREVVRAIAASDTAALQRAWVGRAEWAYLYVPTSIYMRAPYEMPPAVQWELSLASSEKGVLRLLRRLGGQPLRFDEVVCDGEPEAQGENRLWRGCRVTFALEGAGTPVTRVLYRGVLERGGVFKVLSYGNDF